MTTATTLPKTRDEDHAALFAACEAGVALCTIVGIEGSFSRRLGAQMAVYPDGTTVGSLSDGCLKRQLASDVRSLSEPEVRRYGAGSDKIDFRLPCGGGLDILLEPEPDREACRRAAVTLANRFTARLALPEPSPLPRRKYLPSLALRIFGEGPEVRALSGLARHMGIAVEDVTTGVLSLDQASGLPPADAWTAVVLLFHDHEWELALLEEALAGEAFFIGAQGGENARIARTTGLLARGVPEEAIARIRSPIGLIPSCKTPGTLALSTLAEIVAEYGRLRDAA